MDLIFLNDAFAKIATVILPLDVVLLIKSPDDHWDGRVDK